MSGAPSKGRGESGIHARGLVAQEIALHGAPFVLMEAFAGTVLLSALGWAVLAKNDTGAASITALGILFLGQAANYAALLVYVVDRARWDSAELAAAAEPGEPDRHRHQYFVPTALVTLVPLAFAALAARDAWEARGRRGHE